MRQISIKVGCVDGSNRTGLVLLPESVVEFIEVLSEPECLKMLQREYLKTQKRRLKTGYRGKKRVLKVTLKDLTEDQRLKLMEMGLL